MNIALLAHDSKKELMIQFCTAYRGILSRHSLFAPTTTGKIVSRAMDKPVALFLPCAGGGSQQVGHRIVCGEVDMVLFFCDASGQANTQDADYIARLCDRYTIPIATNIATAEVLVQGLRYKDMKGY